jgi:hypothetical protein
MLTIGIKLSVQHKGEIDVTDVAIFTSADTARAVPKSNDQLIGRGSG